MCFLYLREYLYHPYAYIQTNIYLHIICLLADQFTFQYIIFNGLCELRLLFLSSGRQKGAAHQRRKQNFNNNNKTMPHKRITANSPLLYILLFSYEN